MGTSVGPRFRKLAIVLAVVTAGTSVTTGPAAATPQQQPPAVQPAGPGDPPDTTRSIPTAQRAETLGKEWRSSPDRAVTTSGDAEGFHLLVGDSSHGYAWRTIASLSEPGIETDQWIGNMCVTGSGRRAVVVYAPRHFSNRDYLLERGAFSAVVDLRSGAVRKLPITTSLAYFNPGCGADESAVLTQGGGDSLAKTRLHTLDAAAGKLGRPVVVKGQITSAIPTKRGIVAAAGGALVKVSANGATTPIAKTAGVPYRMAADADGGVVFLQSSDFKTAQARRAALGARTAKVSTLATGDINEIGTATGRGGAVFVTGTSTRSQGSVPASVRFARVGREASLSLNGSVALTKVMAPRGRFAPGTPDSLADERPVQISATSLSTGKAFTLDAVPTPIGGPGATRTPALAGTSVAGDPNDPTDGDLRTCAVRRNDPRNQPMQPKPRQVEWAVNQLVQDSLNVTREANWKNLGMPSYSVTQMFPKRSLVGGGRVPAQILLGIATAESNLSQAAWFAVPGVTANPLISNYYGVGNREDPVEQWLINFAEADCGYGVMQVTDNMRSGETGLSWDQKRAVANDFVANIAEGQRILAGKWNETRNDGLYLHDGNPNRLENWFYALWVYNSGYHRKADKDGSFDGTPNNGAWGVGWVNNPINPIWDRGRGTFLDGSPQDAATPQKWPYPEKVLGYAAQPVELIESPGVMVPAFRAAWWGTADDRTRSKPPIHQFCEIAVNSCSVENFDQHLNPCVRADSKCWYNKPTSWHRFCDSQCGNEFIRFDSGYPYQDDGTAYPPNCALTGLPSGALIVDNLATSVPSIRPGCSKSFTNAGSFQLTFVGDGNGTYRSKLDTHQLGTGFGGHFWMSNTYTDQAPSMKVTGTWTFNSGSGSWARVLVHLPVVGARTQQAKYEIDIAGNGSYGKARYIPQEIQKNGWVSLGIVKFAGTPRVRLSNMTKDGRGADRIAWDAVAIQRLPAKPKHIVAALGDSYSSGEGAGSYYAESNANHGTANWNACRRSKNSWHRKLQLPGTTSTLGSLSDQFNPNYELGFVACSGADTFNMNNASTIPEWWVYPEKYGLGNGQFHEVSQLNSGALDTNTTLVTLTIGGNDEKAFTNAIKECTFGNCAWNSEDFQAHYRSIIDRTRQKIYDTISEIKVKAPNAQIILAGYPKLLSETTTCTSAVGLDTPEQIQLGDLAEYMWSAQTQTTSLLRTNLSIRVNSVNAITPFTGHGGCDDPEWIYTVVVGTDGEGDFHSGDDAEEACLVIDALCVSRRSYHPKTEGTSAYADAVEERLVALGYNGG